MVQIEYNIQASECRKEAKNVSVSKWSDDDVNTRIDLWTAKFHNDVGRTSAWTLADNPIEYKLAKLAIMHAVAADILSSTQDSAADAEKKMKEYEDIVSGFSENQSIVVSGGHNHADELEPDNYIAIQSDTTPDIGVDNGIFS
jgi:hypothetical protein